MEENKKEVRTAVEFGGLRPEPSAEIDHPPAPKKSVFRQLSTFLAFMAIGMSLASLGIAWYNNRNFDRELKRYYATLDQRVSKAMESDRQTTLEKVSFAIEEEIREKDTPAHSEAVLAALYHVRAELNFSWDNLPPAYNDLLLHAKYQLKTGQMISDRAERLWQATCHYLSVGGYFSHLSEPERLARVAQLAEERSKGLALVAEEKMNPEADAEPPAETADSAGVNGS